jgi:glycosyltransferase involved in cell wall biosynthesis
MSSASQYLVSVIIPAYKMGEFIGEALDSVGAQTYPHWEVLVVDDAGPEDGTRAAVEAFAGKHPDHRVEYIRHERNCGVSEARLSGINAARGELVALLDADDQCLPRRLQDQIAVFDRYPNVVLSHGPVEAVGDNSSAAKEAEECFALEADEQPYDLRSRSYALVSNHICTSTVMFRRAAVGDDCFTRNMVFQFEDWYMWLVLARRGAYCGAPGQLTRYRLHPQSFSSGLAADSRRHALARLELLAALLAVRDDFRWSLRVARNLLECLLFVSSSRTGAGRTGSARRRMAQLYYLMLGCGACLLGRLSGVARRAS